MIEKKEKYRGMSFEQRQAMRDGNYNAQESNIHSLTNNEYDNFYSELKKRKKNKHNSSNQERSEINKIRRAKELLKRIEDRFSEEFGLDDYDTSEGNKSDEDPYRVKKRNKKAKNRKEKEQDKHKIKKAPPMTTQSAANMGAKQIQTKSIEDGTNLDTAKEVRENLRKAMIWSEILAPPLSKRRHFRGE